MYIFNDVPIISIIVCMHAEIFTMGNPRFKDEGFQKGQKTVVEFQTDMRKRFGQLDTAQTMVWESLALSGVLLAVFLRDVDGNLWMPPNPHKPSPMDFMADPEIKEWSEQMNQDPMDPTGAYDKRRTKLARLVNDAEDKWKAEHTKWGDHMFLCLALRKMGQDEALLFLEEVRGHYYISLRCAHPCDVYMTHLYCINRRPG